MLLQQFPFVILNNAMDFVYMHISQDKKTEKSLSFDGTGIL